MTDITVTDTEGIRAVANRLDKSTEKGEAVMVRCSSVYHAPDDSSRGWGLLVTHITTVVQIPPARYSEDTEPISSVEFSPTRDIREAINQIGGR